MATYVNDLRLKEIATGDEAGTWGTSTNTNLELIGEALGYGTQDCFASDADATTTVADGASDPARAMYFKITSSATLTATRTLTISPNTISRVMLIENATTGSQSITISQGSGSTVTIASGAVKMVYLDGAGAGGAVVEALADLELPTITVADLTATTADINGGTIDGTVIGGTTPAAVTTSSLVATTADINGGTIDGTVIGGSTAAAGTFTTVTADGLTLDAGANINFNETGGADILWGTSTYSYITGNAGAGTLTAGTNSIERFRIAGNGNISFYEDLGVTPKFVWDASAESLGIGTSSPGRTLDVSGVIRSDGTSGAFALGGNSSTPTEGAAIHRPAADTLAFVTASTERMRIDSSGNVGIGGTPSTHRLEVKGDNNIAKFYSDATATELKIVAPTVNVIGLYTGIADALVLGTADTERARIDSAGNLLVGTTNTLPAESNVEGIALSAGTYGGLLSVSRAGNRAATFNRTTSDGEIIQLRKDGSTVGSIGANSGNIYIGESDTTLMFVGGTSVIIPTGTNGVTRDGAINLGNSSNRFKDLYLSGGVYLGGTGSANLLDDYEEGTWTATPTFASGTGTGASSGRYTKVGDLVCATVYMGGGIGTGSGIFTITGLPFACGLTTAVSIRTAGIGATGTVLQANVVSGGTTINFLLAPQSTSLAGASPTAAEMNTPDFYIQLSVSYHV